MTDITKCANKECPLKDSCWRYIAPVSKYQSWFSTPPPKRNEKGKYVCDMFWDKDKQ